jgi:hypothetical protein
LLPEKSPEQTNSWENPSKQARVTYKQKKKQKLRFASARPLHAGLFQCKGTEKRDAFQILSERRLRQKVYSLPPPDVTVAVMEAQEIARKERTASLRPGILGGKSEKKEAHAMREVEEETTTGRGRRELVRFSEPV